MNKIRLLTMLLPLLIGACAPAASRTKGPPPSPVVASPQALAVGQAVQIGTEASLRFLRVANDSRCPKDAQCIWAGEVGLALVLSDRQGNTAFGLSSTTSPKATIKGYAFELLGYGACPEGRSGECATIAFHPSP